MVLFFHESALFIAIENEDIPMIKLLLSSNRFNPNICQILNAKFPNKISKIKLNYVSKSNQFFNHVSMFLLINNISKILYSNYIWAK